MGSAVQADQAKYERALARYLRIPADDRRSGHREKILRILGVENPREFLAMHIPLWLAKIDELLDPSCTDMLPVSISHSYVNWVRGAIRSMPGGVRVKIFASKLEATGLKEATRSLLSRMTGNVPGDFVVTFVELVEKVHKDTLFGVRDDAGREHSLYISRFGCLGEYVYAGIPPLVGLPALPVVHHVTPQGEEVLIKPMEEGTNIFLHDDLSASRIQEEGPWWVEGAARQDALGDCIGTVLRFGHYVATPDRKVIMIDNIELFHLDESDVRIFEPIHDFLPRKAFPQDARRRKDLHRSMRADYDQAYRDQMRAIAQEWGGIERYFVQMRRHIRAYTGEPFEKVLAGVKARVFGTR